MTATTTVTITADATAPTINLMDTPSSFEAGAGAAKPGHDAGKHRQADRCQARLQAHDQQYRGGRLTPFARAAASHLQLCRSPAEPANRRRR